MRHRARVQLDAFLHTLFFTGARPSELAAVRVRNVKLNAGTVRILESIHRGHRGAVKTRSSNRTVRLHVPGDLEILKPCLELKARPDDFFFRNVRGEPVEPANFYDAFVDAQRALGISPVRDLYSTKDTYISNALTRGINLTWLSGQTGVAEATIKKHYGRYMHTQDRDHLEISKIARPALPRLSQAPSEDTGAQENLAGTARRPRKLIALAKGGEESALMTSTSIALATANAGLTTSAGKIQ